MTAHFMLPLKMFVASEDFVDDGVDDAAVLLLLAIAAPTGRIKPLSTPDGDVLEPVLAAAAL